MKSSGLAHREQIQFGSGATTYVATTINGRKLCQMADERITSRNPTARTCFPPSGQSFILPQIPAVASHSQTTVQ